MPEIKQKYSQLFSSYTYEQKEQLYEALAEFFSERSIISSYFSRVIQIGSSALSDKPSSIVLALIKKHVPSFRNKDTTC